MAQLRQVKEKWPSSCIFATWVSSVVPLLISTLLQATTKSVKQMLALKSQKVTITVLSSLSVPMQELGTGSVQIFLMSFHGKDQ